MRRLPVLLSLLVWPACTGDITSPGGDDTDPSDPSDPGGSDEEPIGPQDPNYEEQHPRIYLPRNLERLQAGLARPAGARFRQWVDTQMGGAELYDYHAWFGALIGALTGEPAYCAYAVDRVDAFVASEEALISAGARAQVAADSYLEVGAKVGDVMLTYDWCYAATTESQRTRWADYAAAAVWNVWHPDEATWGGAAHPWSGWSIDNPSNNYYYSFLRATMLFGLATRGEHPDADGWLTFFREQKLQGQLLPTFEADLRGGGSREGTGYGVSMQSLWSLYDFWQGSTGEDLARQTTHTRASLLNMIHAIVPTLDRIAPIGDHARDSTASLFDYHRNYVRELTYLFREDALAPRAEWMIASSSVPEMGQGFMRVYDFLYDNPEVTAQPLDGLGTAYYAPGIGELYARSGWDTDATWVNLIAGPYTESHAHKDQGSFMVFKGDWLAYDPNVESHSGIRQEEELHNLVRITAGGQTVRQREGTASEVTALAQGDGWLHVAADITPVYDGNAAVQNVERELVYLEPDVVVIYDRVTTASGTQQIWQLSSPVAPSNAGNKTTFATGGHDLVVHRVGPSAPALSVLDWSSDSEFSGGYRHDETLGGGAQQHLHVVSIDGTVTSATASNAGGRTGVIIELADGRTATVRFSPTGVDGTLEISDGTSVTLDTGVGNLAQ